MGWREGGSVREYAIEGKTIEIAKWEGRSLHLYMRHGREFILSPIPDSSDVRLFENKKEYSE